MPSKRSREEAERAAMEADGLDGPIDHPSRNLAALPEGVIAAVVKGGKTFEAALRDAQENRGK